MFRKDREITDREAIESILREAPVIHIGMIDFGMPYVVPMNFAFREGCIYLHSARHGLKMDIISRNPRICFEAEVNLGTIPGDTVCSWGFRYRSVIGFGTAILIDEPKEKRAGLDCIVEKYSGISSGDYSEDKLRGIAVIGIDIESMTGKEAE